MSTEHAFYVVVADILYTPLTKLVNSQNSTPLCMGSSKALSAAPSKLGTSIIGG